MFATATALALALPLASSPAALAENEWQPFVERDARRQAQPTARDPRPFLDPMTPGDRRASTPGGWVAQPPGQGDEPVDARGNSFDPTVAGADGRPPLAGASPPGTYAPPPTYLPPVAAGQPVIERSAVAVERSDLTPVAVGDGSGLPFELWQGLDVETAERLLRAIDIPPRSPALHSLWLRLLTSEAPGASDQLNVLRVESLLRGGRLTEAGRIADGLDAARLSPPAQLLLARLALARGQDDAACALVKTGAAKKNEMPRPLRPDAIVLAGLCAAIAGNKSAGGLAADLAREEGLRDATTLGLLSALSTGKAPRPTRPLSAIDARMMAVAGLQPPVLGPAGIAAGGAVGQRAVDASFLGAMLSGAAASGPQIANRPLPAVEAAAALNVIDPPMLGRAYGEAAAGGSDPAAQRAANYQIATTERTPNRKTRAIRAFLDEARRAGIQGPAMIAVADAVGEIGRAPEIGWFAETAIEVSTAAGRYREARSWLIFARALDPRTTGQLGHWQALIDIADPEARERRDEALALLDAAAQRSAFNAETLHRLATVLDALDYQVPIPLWEAASRTPQPATGFLPATGVLRELADSAGKREFGKTLLLALQALGPNGAEGAHIIALGDVIRSLRKAGLEKDARRLALEALLGGWPRGLQG